MSYKQAKDTKNYLEDDVYVQQPVEQDVQDHDKAIEPEGKAYANGPEMLSEGDTNRGNGRGSEDMPERGSDDARSDLHSIMTQFQASIINDTSATHANEDSLRLQQPPSNHPRRVSSLEGHESHPMQTPATAQAGSKPNRVDKPNQVMHDTTLGEASPTISTLHGGLESKMMLPSSPMSPVNAPAINKSLPPAPDPEPDLPFDFHRFLEQLRHRTADPVAKFLRSFLTEFGKKQWMVHEQMKIISDFLAFINSKMQQCEIWREVSDAEFDNAKEGMEKLVMNRLYTQTFSPAIPPPSTISAEKGKKKSNERSTTPGRRGQHQEDIERDEILAQKVRIYNWVEERHLDIEPVGDNGKRFLRLAQQELLKIASYRAPRDKVICVLNCCKVIFGLLRNSKSSDTSADSFIPLLIYVVLRAKPENVVSNIQYILRFRSQDKLGGEAGYYLSSLMGAIQFIENLDRTSLTVSDIEFEKNVEAAVSAIAEKEKPSNSMHNTRSGEYELQDVMPERRHQDVDHEKGHSSEGKSHVDPVGSLTSDEKLPMGSLLNAIQKPLTSIGRMFSDETSSIHHNNGPRLEASSADVSHDTRRLSPSLFQPPRLGTQHEEPSASHLSEAPRIYRQDFDPRQLDLNNDSVQSGRMVGHGDVVETLVGMFPTLDRDVIEDVVRMKEGRVGAAVDACLALNT